MSRSHVPTPLALEAPLTISTVQAAREAILASLAEHNAVAIDLANTAAVDIAGAQLLYSALVHAGMRNKTLTLAQPAQGPLLDTLTRGGFLDAMTAQERQFFLHEGVRS